MGLTKQGLERLWAHITNLVGGKVDKIDGKGLSTNDFTTDEKNKLAGITAGANAYTHPTSAGNKHIPDGGSSGQILRWSAAGTAAWGADNSTTYDPVSTTADGLMTAADKVKLNGLPTPTTSDAGKFLRVNSAGAYELVAMANAEEATF